MTSQIFLKCITNCCKDFYTHGLLSLLNLIIVLINLSLLILLIMLPAILGSNVNCEGSLSTCIFHAGYKGIDLGYGIGLVIMYSLVLSNIECICNSNIYIIQKLWEPRIKIIDSCMESSMFDKITLSKKYTNMSLSPNGMILYKLSIIIPLLFIWIPGTFIGLCLSKISPDTRPIENGIRYGTNYINDISYIAPGLLIANIGIIFIYRIIILSVKYYSEAQKELNRATPLNSYEISRVPTAKREEIPYATSIGHV